MTNQNQIKKNTWHYQDFEFVTSVDLNYAEAKIDKKTKPVCHFLYASQLYGTLFAIYGQFVGVKHEDGFAIKELSMKLLNYKGVINIGFTKDKLVWKKVGNKDNLYFVVQGLSTTVVKNFIFPKPVVIKKGERFPITFNRLLRPLPDFEKYLVKRNGSTASGLIKGEPPLVPLFDSEFNDRDGIDFYDNEIKPGMFRGSKLGPEAAGWRCNNSTVSLYF